MPAQTPPGRPRVAPPANPPARPLGHQNHSSLAVCARDTRPRHLSVRHAANGVAQPRHLAVALPGQASPRPLRPSSSSPFSLSYLRHCSPPRARLEHPGHHCHGCRARLAAEPPSPATLSPNQPPERIALDPVNLPSPAAPSFLLTQNRANTLECARTRERSSKRSTPAKPWADRSDRFRRPV